MVGWLVNSEAAAFVCSLAECTQLLQMILFIAGIGHTLVSRYRMGIGLTNVCFYNNPVF